MSDSIAIARFDAVLREIRDENDGRRRGDEDVPWTWEQWDRMIAAGERYGVPRYLRQAFEMTKIRVAKAKADGRSAVFFHHALALVVSISAPKIAFGPQRPR